MRRRVMRRGGVAVFLMGLALLVAACGGASTSKPTVAGLGVKKLSAGNVEVTVTPRQIDAAGARFDITLDTHSGDLGALDIARSSTLEVGGRRWSSARWSGDGSGGHHRSGNLEFSSTGDASGAVRLVIAGLPSALVVEWQR